MVTIEEWRADRKMFQAVTSGTGLPTITRYEADRLERLENHGKSELVRTVTCPTCSYKYPLQNTLRCCFYCKTKLTETEELPLARAGSRSGERK